MAVSEVTDPEKGASKDAAKPKDKRERTPTKVVVRRLPPEMSQEDFLTQVSPLPEYDYIYNVRGEASQGENAFTRVYINFVNSSDVFTFKERFDNYVFVDKRGHEYPAVVEFATFQKVPRRQQRKYRTDPKAGTIESDPCYQEFLESLKEQPAQEEKPEFSYQFNTDNKENVSTPLLDFVKQRRIDKQRIREERREERRKREIERKKLREVAQQKPAPKITARKHESNALNEEEIEVQSVEQAKDGDKDKVDNPPASTDSVTSSKYPKFNDKNKFKASRPEKPDFRNRRDEFRNRRYEKEVSSTPKKPKKYSEKREERKNEAKKKEEKESQQAGSVLEAHAESESVLKKAGVGDQDPIEDIVEKRGHETTGKKSDPRTQRRIKNKDRPTMALYQPGMLSKRKTTEEKGEVDNGKSEQE